MRAAKPKTTESTQKVDNVEPLLDATTRLDRFGLDPAPSKSRTPEIAVGLLLIVVAALAGLWLYGRATERVEVLALRSDVERGAVLSAADLVVVEVATDDRDLSLLPRSATKELVGRVAVADWPAGTLVSDSMFAVDDVVQSDSATVSVEVEAGAFPVEGLARGDAVLVVLTPAGVEAPTATESKGPLLADPATVLEVVPVGTADARRVSMVMDRDDARAVAVAAAQERVRLIKVEEP